VSKRGPTPDPDAPQSVAKRRADGVVLRDRVIDFPPAETSWLPRTREAYRDFTGSDVARAAHEESRNQVRLLFEYWDRVERLLDLDMADDPEPHKTAQAIRIYDGMAARLANELGIGPLARVRLGIKAAEGGSKLADLFGGGG
jgi:hypothetical protein